MIDKHFFNDLAIACNPIETRMKQRKKGIKVAILSLFSTCRISQECRS